MIQSKGQVIKVSLRDFCIAKHKEIEKQMKELETIPLYYLTDNFKELNAQRMILLEIINHY